MANKEILPVTPDELQELKTRPGVKRLFDELAARGADPPFTHRTVTTDASGQEIETYHGPGHSFTPINRSYPDSDQQLPPISSELMCD